MGCESMAENFEITIGKEYEITIEPCNYDYIRDGSGPFEVKSPVFRLNNCLEAILWEKRFVEEEFTDLRQFLEYYIDYDEEENEYEEKGNHFHVSINYEEDEYIKIRDLYERHIAYSFLVPIIRKLFSSPLYKRFRNEVFHWCESINFMNYTDFEDEMLGNGNRYYWILTPNTKEGKQTLEIRLSETSIVYDIIALCYLEAFYVYLRQTRRFEEFNQKVNNLVINFRDLIYGKKCILPYIYYYKNDNTEKYNQILIELGLFELNEVTIYEYKYKTEIEKLRLKNIWKKLKKYWTYSYAYNKQTNYLVQLFEEYYLSGKKTALEFIELVYHKVEDLKKRELI